MKTNAFRIAWTLRCTRTLGALLTALALGLSTGAAAQSADTMTLVVPYPPGGSGDALGRLLAEELGKALNRSVIVDNRAGASGVVAMNYTAKSAPNGNTIMLATNGPLVMAIPMMNNLPLDIETDLSPVAMVAAQSMVMVARDDAPYNNMRELLAYARANPGAVNRGAVGQANMTNLGFLRLEQREKIQTTLVPFKGDAAGLTELLGRRLDVYVGAGNVIRQSVAAGRIKGIAVLVQHPVNSFHIY